MATIKSQIRAAASLINDLSITAAKIANATITGAKLAANIAISTTGAILHTGTAGFGYGTGAGGSVTQATSKSTGATLSKVCGTVTMHNEALAAATAVSFTLTNTTITANDVIAISHVSGGTVGAYTVTAAAGAGSATVTIRNNTAGSLGEALVLRFAVIKAVVA